MAAQFSQNGHPLRASGDALEPARLGRHAEVRLASAAEKKRLWWRNALVNALFIASWCAQQSLTLIVNNEVTSSFVFLAGSSSH
jgi:hypothetical protein